jgi:hypothetical protein
MHGRALRTDTISRPKTPNFEESQRRLMEPLNQKSFAFDTGDQALSPEVPP